VVSDYWVDHRECFQLIDLQIVLHWRFSDQHELLVSFLNLVVFVGSQVGSHRSDRSIVAKDGFQISDQIGFSFGVL
jgi:hypothetical protein